VLRLSCSEFTSFMLSNEYLRVIEALHVGTEYLHESFKK
jgi:hypothetical protein